MKVRVPGFHVYPYKQIPNVKISLFQHPTFQTASFGPWSPETTNQDGPLLTDAPAFPGLSSVRYAPAPARLSFAHAIQTPGQMVQDDVLCPYPKRCAQMSA